MLPANFQKHFCWVKESIPIQKMDMPPIPPLQTPLPEIFTIPRSGVECLRAFQALNAWRPQAGPYSVTITHRVMTDDGAVNVFTPAINCIVSPNVWHLHRPNNQKGADTIFIEGNMWIGRDDINWRMLQGEPAKTWNVGPFDDYFFALSISDIRCKGLQLYANAEYLVFEYEASLCGWTRHVVAFFDPASKLPVFEKAAYTVHPGRAIERRRFKFDPTIKICPPI